MRQVFPQSGSVWRATLLLCVLLFGAFAPAVKLVLPQTVTCGMACCEASGVCYCEHPPAGEPSFADETAATPAQAKLAELTLQPGCPPRCAQLPGKVQTFSFTKLPPAALSFTASVPSRRCSILRRARAPPWWQKCMRPAHRPPLLTAS